MTLNHKVVGSTPTASTKICCTYSNSVEITFESWCKMVYTTKFFLIYKDQDDMNYQQFCKNMFDIQRKVRVFKNRASSEYFSFMIRQMQFKDENGRYPTDEELLGYKLRNYLYHLSTDCIPELQTGNASCISEDVCKHFKSKKKDIFAGRVTIPSYGSNQPINFHNKSISFEEADGRLYLTLSVFSRDGKQAYELKSGQCQFEVWHKCESSIEIVKRCVSGQYKVCTSQLQYNQSKKMWEFALSYQFDAEQNILDKNKVLGLDLGIAIPIVAALSDSQKRWFFNGNEIDSFRRKTEEMRRQMSKARVQAGDGSVGHGRSARTKSLDKIGCRIASFRDTKNNALSREIVKIALKNGCGTIQMEDLGGITSGKQPRFLKNWTYFDLQQKIKYKAESAGIDVCLIDPKYTSQRCSCCGYISVNNRKTQSEFVCEKCGYSANADYNAAKNIATKDIAAIIKNECEHQANKKTA